MQLPFVNRVKQPLPWLVGLVVVGLIGTGTIAYLGVRSTPAKTDATDLTVPVKSDRLTIRITASGTIRPVQTVNLSPKAAGRLAELYVEQGDSVKQGQVIARMESDDVEAQLTQARANLAQTEARLAALRNGSRSEDIAQAQASLSQAEAQVKDAQARLDLASERARRNRELEAQGAISRDSLDEVLNTELSARATLEQSNARVREARQRLAELQNGSRPEDIAAAVAERDAAIGRLQAVRVQQEDTLIRAPFSGVITQRFATIGAFVTPTTSASSTTSATSTSVVALANGLEVIAEVPEVDVSQIKLGQKVEISADAFPDQVFEGRVRLIAPEAVVEQNVTSFQVRVTVLTGKDKLRSGMNSDVIFLGKQLDNALIVPTVAIVTNKGQTGVLVPDNNNKPHFQPVTIGTTIGNQTQILEGIRAGERVFIELPEGQKLETVMKQMEKK
ncbi:MAG: efflux RND transporter periplasmic adaptor subunit [Scytolyngbya sp. HA4215-MV1]|jgi:HlyD family secretion protein|nr:efflux RND transporter periplasmic adaptor subunit [Scytolyngbya sp. HA4215-MV1]